TTGAALTYTIQSTGAGQLLGSGTAPRILYVADANSTLTISSLLGTPGSNIVKDGDGTLVLTGANNTTLNAGNTQFVLNQGVLRGTVGTSLGTQANTSVAFRGGVLELTGGVAFTNGLGTGGGTVNWHTGATDFGSGGFSANGAAASVNIGGAG